MTENEQIQYLANVFHVARADKRLDGIEDSIAEEIAQGIGAGYLQTRKALDLASQKDYCVEFPARLSDRIRNFEDMLLVACCDQKLHDLEKKIIVDFAKQIPITQEQVNVIRKEVKARLAQQ